MSITLDLLPAAVPGRGRQGGRLGDGGEPRPEALLPPARHAAGRGRRRRRVPRRAPVEDVRL